MKFPACLFAVAAALASASAPAAIPPARIPLVEGLVITTAVQRPTGDEEQVTTVSAVTPDHVELSVEFRQLKDGVLDVQQRTRRMRRADMAASNRLNQVFQDGDALMFPGSTMSMLSAQSLASLKRDGKVAMVLGTVPGFGEEASGLSALGVAMGRKYLRGDLVRVGGGTVPVTVKVNGEPRTFQAVHARASMSVAKDRVDWETWVMDDPEFALGLKGRQDRGIGQTVRIDYPMATPRASVLEQALEETCRAELHGIYFDFGQASLLAASAPALAAVAKLMADNPSWTLNIEGHTDNVGGAAYNLDLSRRRAEAVRGALTGAFKISPVRLQATGLGAGKPVASNTTLEGRAANRRVELARRCP